MVPMGTTYGLGLASTLVLVVGGGVWVVRQRHQHAAARAAARRAAAAQRRTERATAAAARRQEATTAIADEHAAQPPNRRHVVLLATPEEGALEIRDRLERVGYRVVQARDGREAWRILQERLPDVMVFDDRVDGIGARQMLMQLRRDLTLVTLPVVVCTRPDRMADCLEMGARGVVMTDDPSDALIEQVRCALLSPPPDPV